MSDLYDYATDVAAWGAEQQAGLLRRRASGQLPNDAGLDWENLAEEIEGVAASQKREIRNRLKRICQHLLKWRHSTRPPSRSWRDTLDEQREQLDDLFKDSPSLRRFAADALPAAFVNGRRAAEQEAGPLKLADDVCPWSLEQVLALDFFPDRLLAPAGILRETARQRTRMTARIVTTVHRYKRPPKKRKAVAIEAHRFPEQSANTTTYWLSTKTELKDPTITLHVEGCPVLRRIQWRTLRVLTGPLTWAQIAVLPDHGYQACGRCKPAAS